MRIIGFIAGLAASTAMAGEVEIVDATATRSGDAWRFDVTLRHDDTGWEHYADAWRVVGPDGEVLGTRILAHPHVNEQPFTRSLGGVAIPDGVTVVHIQAREKDHDWAPGLFELPLDQ
ncbi:hypothetical protein KHP62_10240 [Rhodobacteraceae bacterium NNCM2]|nr:hypothetical protein [Coraliihabitans acroporae]